MPYITNRQDFDSEINELQARLRTIPREKRKGACNYVVSRIAAGIFPQDYHGISDAIGALRDAATEMERRLMAPRENKAIAENGDLPEYE